MPRRPGNQWVIDVPLQIVALQPTRIPLINSDGSIFVQWTTAYEALSFSLPLFLPRCMFRVITGPQFWLLKWSSHLSQHRLSSIWRWLDSKVTPASTKPVHFRAEKNEYFRDHCSHYRSEVKWSFACVRGKNELKSINDIIRRCNMHDENEVMGRWCAWWNEAALTSLGGSSWQQCRMLGLKSSKVGTRDAGSAASRRDSNTHCHGRPPPRCFLGMAAPLALQAQGPTLLFCFLSANLRLFRALKAWTSAL